MNNSVKKNFIYNSIFQVALLLIPLITTPYVSRVLGAENIGKYSFATAIATYFVVAAGLGSTIYGQRLIAFNRDDKALLSDAFWDIFSFRLISTLIMMGAYFSCLFLASDINLLNTLVSLNIINVAVDITWFFQGIEEFRKTVLINVIIKTIGLAGIFLFVKQKGDTWLYTLIYCGSFIVGNLILWLPLTKYITRPSQIKPFKHLKGMILIFLPTIASQVYTVLDKSMIGWITNSDYANGCYEQSEKLARAALTIVTAIGVVVLPRVANLYNKGDIITAKRYIYKSYRVTWALGLPIMFGTVSVASWLIPLYLGEGFDLSCILLQVFSLLIVFVSLAYVTGVSYLTPTNQQNIYTISVVIAAIVNFFMNLVLIRHMGALGAAISSVSAEGIGALIQICYCISTKQLELRNIIRPSIKYLIASALMFAVIEVSKQVISISVLNLVLLVLIGMITYSIVLIIERDELTLECLSLIRSKMRPRFRKN